VYLEAGFIIQSCPFICAFNGEVMIWVLELDWTFGVWTVRFCDACCGSC